MTKRENKKGFTIIETLVAITILVFGVVAPLTAVSRAINASIIAKDKISAFYFAQEGVEYVRYIRDTNILKGKASWLQHLGHCLGANGCYIDDILESVPGGGNAPMGGNCGAGQCRFIEYRPSEGRFGFFNGGSDEDTKFRRRINIVETIPDIEAEITVTVIWVTKGTSNVNPYVLRETMFNWSGG